jgi:adenylate cyclase
MNEAFFTELSAWLTQAGLAGTSETDIVSGLCDRCVAAGLPLARTQVFIDTLHPVHEGRLFRWGFGPTEPPLLDYGRTTPDALAASGSHPLAAVNETNRIAAMCRSVDQPVLMSAAFADV